MSDGVVLRPSEFAERLSVNTRVVIQAMYERRVPRVRLGDGTLGIPAEALESFEGPAS